ncbi:MAG: helix-turn-helix transcriptional regulator [Chthoniobacterales bacterium]
MHDRPAALDAYLNAAVSELLAILFENRQAEVAQTMVAGKSYSPDVQNPITKMALYPDRQWRVKDLARLSGLSELHFYRRFRKATGSSPIDWLRRERINHACRRLLQSNDPIKQVAEQVGYNDPFFFSRDFKRYTGLPPSEYRREHLPMRQRKSTSRT